MVLSRRYTVKILWGDENVKPLKEGPWFPLEETQNKSTGENEKRPLRAKSIKILFEET
jgi:hypothetical protein